MKIAFLLTLYHNAKQCNLFINQLLDSSNSHVFIHFDAKSKGLEKEIIKHDRIHVIPENYDVQWGDYSQIQANLALMKYAKKFGDFDYYSVHSGNDLLVQSLQELETFLSQDAKYAYLDCYALPHKQFQYGGGLGRVALKWPRVFRKKCSQNSPIRYMRSLYGKAYGVGIIRGRKLPHNMIFYGQSDWFTLSGKCVTRILNYIEKKPEILKLFETSLIGSELFFNTLAYRTKGERDIIDQHNNLRYIDFKNVDKNTPGSPKLLIEMDYDEIKKSNCFFARKVDCKNRESNVLIQHFVSDLT